MDDTPLHRGAERAQRRACLVARAAVGAEEIPLPRGVAFHFRQFGELVVVDADSIDVHRSPLVTVFVPHARRGILWTVGEVHVWATPLRSVFSGLHRFNRAFAGWLRQFECVFAKAQARYPRVDLPFAGIGAKFRSSDFCPTVGLKP